MGVNLVFTSPSSTSNVINKGANVPPWYNNYSLSSRYNESAYYYYNKVGNDVYIQYGVPDRNWATNKFYGYTINTDVVNEDDKGNISVDVTVQLNFYVSRHAYPLGATIKTNHKFYFNNVLVHEFSGATKDEFTVGKKSPVKFRLNLSPEQVSNATAIKIVSTYPNKEFKNESIFLGFAIKNTNKKIVNYVPMAIRKSGNWKSLNKNKGFIKIRKSGNWVDKSKEDLSTKGQVNKGKNRIRKSGNWKQQKDF